jgi:hypothetical protein
MTRESQRSALLTFLDTPPSQRPADPIKSPDAFAIAKARRIVEEADGRTAHI